MTLFQGKFRIESTRLRYWDYTNYGWYFVTINVQNHACVLGDIVDGEILLSSAGKIVQQEILHTARRRPSVTIDVWQVMPNHLHGIFIIDNWKRKDQKVDMHSPLRRTPYEEPEPEMKLRADSLGAIMNQFKGECTKRIRRHLMPEFCWQERFHDHIIRNEKSLQSIREYIINNPMQWEQDKYHPTNL
jgi:putative transposase